MKPPRLSPQQPRSRSRGAGRPDYENMLTD